MGYLRKVFPKDPITQGKSGGKFITTGRPPPMYWWPLGVFSLQVEGTQPSAGWSTCLCTLSCTSTISWPPLESGMTVDQPSTGSSLKKNSVQSSTGSPLISLFFCNFYIFDIFRHKKNIDIFSHFDSKWWSWKRWKKSLLYKMQLLYLDLDCLTIPPSSHILEKSFCGGRSTLPACRWFRYLGRLLVRTFCLNDLYFIMDRRADGRSSLMGKFGKDSFRCVASL